jgi:hypothetical protein
LSPDPPSGNVGDNAREAQCGAAPAPPAPGGTYKLGDALSAVFPLPGGAAARGRFAVPAAAASAACDDGVLQVGFLQRVPRSLKVCGRVVFCCNIE